MKKLNNKGFSLIELIVVIAIMAVLMAVLVPSILGYVEKSRMQRDDSAMSEVVESFKLALCDFDTYDEAYSYAAEGNYLTYTDSSGVYGQRIMDEEYWTPDGSGKCLTITFNPDEDGSYNIGQGIINDMTAGNGSVAEKLEDAEHGIFSKIELLSSKVRQIVGGTVENISATYKNSSYTVFIVFDDIVGVYGQWNGTNLPETADDSGSSMPEHEHSLVTMAEAFTTCTTDGWRIVRCTTCGEEFEEMGTPATGHNYQETSRIDAGINTEGQITYTCSGCGARRYESIPALT